MKSTFWMTAQETEDELKSRELKPDVMSRKQVAQFLWDAIGHITDGANALGTIDARVILRRAICELEGNRCSCE